MPNTLLPNYTVSLRVVDAAGVGVSGLRVRALDHDRGREPNELGEGSTEPDGTLIISFEGKGAGGDKSAPQRSDRHGQRRTGLTAVAFG